MKAVSQQHRMHKAFNFIEKNKELADFESGASKDEIRQAEQFIGLRFPESYKLFLAKYGVGDFNGREFFGIMPGKLPGSSAPSLVWLTLDERQTSGLPDHLIPISSTSYGSYICLDTSKIENSENPVVEWINQYNEQRLIASDFSEFFFQEIKKST